MRVIFEVDGERTAAADMTAVPRIGEHLVTAAAPAEIVDVLWGTDPDTLEWVAVVEARAAAPSGNVDIPADQ